MENPEEFLRDVCPNHTERSKWNKSELLHILELYKDELIPKEKFRKVKQHNGFKIGDTIHIKRWYYPENSKDFSKIGNCIMVDVKEKIDDITIDDNTGKDTIWCGKYSTSSTDIANKGKV